VVGRFKVIHAVNKKQEHSLVNSQELGSARLQESFRELAAKALGFIERTCDSFSNNCLAFWVRHESVEPDLFVTNHRVRGDRQLAATA
jgi:hypothetical protein